MTEHEINWIYIRQRLKYIMPDCLITDELIKEIYQMLMEIYQEGMNKSKQENEQLKTRKRYIIL